MICLTKGTVLSTGRDIGTDLTMTMIMKIFTIKKITMLMMPIPLRSTRFHHSSWHSPPRYGPIFRKSSFTLREWKWVMIIWESESGKRSNSLSLSPPVAVQCDGSVHCRKDLYGDKGDDDGDHDAGKIVDDDDNDGDEDANDEAKNLFCSFPPLCIPQCPTSGGCSPCSCRPGWERWWWRCWWWFCLWWWR